MSLRSFLLFALTAASLFLSPSAGAQDEIFPLSGEWRFALDPNDRGVSEQWFKPNFRSRIWRAVDVPHTWQVEPGLENYYGIAWYQKRVAAHPAWEGKRMRIEFDAVYRDAQVWVNGVLVGEHKGSGWTPFSFALENVWNVDRDNMIAVRVDNLFSKNAIPYERSFDWPADGGIIRNVRLRLSPPDSIESIYVDAAPDEELGAALLEARVKVNGFSNVQVKVSVYNPGGRQVYTGAFPVTERDGAREARIVAVLSRPQLWHFDHPNLYRFQAELMKDGKAIHSKEIAFGVRKVQMKDGLFWLNGEPMRLMGVEWMPGSDPRYGMAEDPRVMREILTDMKNLNCLLTRFHWQQDDAVFEFCDREGILVQEEVPAWGGKTMEGQLDDLQRSQTREMIQDHFNSPSIYAWGLCNEIGGQSQKAHEFVRKGAEIARALDPSRLLTWASNSLQTTPEKDASSLVDFVEWNDYWESWYKGSLADVEANLERIHNAFPQKSLVISEYGLCECDPRNPSGDERRIEILKTHTDAYRRSGAVAGAIFFDYNDYRTHMGDKGQGSFQQRVHGVVDLFGQRKPSWEALRREASPIRSLRIGKPETLGEKTYADVEIVTRSIENDLPAYTLRDYLLTWIAYNDLGQPIGTGKRIMAELPPGTKRTETIDWPVFENLARVKAEIFRPTGYSVLDAKWEKENAAK